MHPKSMLGPLGVLLLLTGVVAGAGAVEFNGRLHNTILGGGDTQSSNEGRVVEWNMAEPHILANPVTGHGLNMGAEVVGFVTPGGNLTLDSYVISLLVECGIPGLLAFFGMVALGFAKGALRYLLDSTVAGPLCGALSCGVLAYGINRLVLSQRENQSLFFIYIALLVLLTLRDRGPSSGRRERARATTRKPNVEVVYDA
jgi:O-antigen ligase